jgi:hypothetical protein
MLSKSNFLKKFLEEDGDYSAGFNKTRDFRVSSKTLTGNSP